jgi:hypothetical protein
MSRFGVRHMLRAKCPIKLVCNYFRSTFLNHVITNNVAYVIRRNPKFIITSQCFDKVRSDRFMCNSFHISFLRTIEKMVVVYEFRHNGQVYCVQADQGTLSFVSVFLAENYAVDSSNFVAFIVMPTKFTDLVSAYDFIYSIKDWIISTIRHYSAFNHTVMPKYSTLKNADIVERDSL